MEPLTEYINRKSGQPSYKIGTTDTDLFSFLESSGYKHVKLTNKDLNSKKSPYEKKIFLKGQQLFTGVDMNDPANRRLVIIYNGIGSDTDYYFTAEIKSNGHIETFRKIQIHPLKVVDNKTASDSDSEKWFIDKLLDNRMMESLNDYLVEYITKKSVSNYSDIGNVIVEGCTVEELTSALRKTGTYKHANIPDWSGTIKQHLHQFIKKGHPSYYGSPLSSQSQTNEKYGKIYVYNGASTYYYMIFYNRKLELVTSKLYNTNGEYIAGSISELRGINVDSLREYIEKGL